MIDAPDPFGETMGTTVSTVVFSRKRQQVQSQSYAVDNDSVDGLPSFEYYPMINGTWSDEELGKLLQPMVQELILPYVRSRYSCEECTVAEILVRRVEVRHGSSQNK